VEATINTALLEADYTPTAASPVRHLTLGQISRYLDCCLVLLAITGKLAALNAQAVPDKGVAAAANDMSFWGPACRARYGRRSP